jgi:hypothetical protein
LRAKEPNSHARNTGSWASVVCILWSNPVFILPFSRKYTQNIQFAPAVIVEAVYIPSGMGRSVETRQISLFLHPVRMHPFSFCFLA